MSDENYYLNLANRARSEQQKLDKIVHICNDEVRRLNTLRSQRKSLELSNHSFLEKEREKTMGVIDELRAKEAKERKKLGGLITSLVNREKTVKSHIVALDEWEKELTNRQKATSVAMDKIRSKSKDLQGKEKELDDLQAYIDSEKEVTEVFASKARSTLSRSLKAAREAMTTASNERKLWAETVEEAKRRLRLIKFQEGILKVRLAEVKKREEKVESDMAQILSAKKQLDERKST